MLVTETRLFELPSGFVKFLRDLETAAVRHAADEIVLQGLCIPHGLRFQQSQRLDG